MSNVNQKGFINILIAIAIVVLVGGVGYFAVKQNSETKVRVEEDAMKMEEDKIEMENDGEKVMEESKKESREDDGDKSKEMEEEPKENDDDKSKEFELIPGVVGIYTNQTYNYKVNYPEGLYFIVESNRSSVVHFSRVGSEAADVTIEVKRNDLGETSGIGSEGEFARSMVSQWAIPQNAKSKIYSSFSQTSFAGKTALTFDYDYKYTIFESGVFIYVLKAFISSEANIQSNTDSIVNSFEFT